MQVFRLYFLCLKRNGGIILAYLLIFLGFVIYLKYSMGNKEYTSFQEERVKIEFVNKDKGSDLILGFYDYLDQYCDIHVLELNKPTIKDTIFYGTLRYRIQIPEGFSQAFMEGRILEIEKESTATAVEEMSIDLLIRHYFETAEFYRNQEGQVSQKELVKLIEENIEKGTEVQVGIGKEDRGHEAFLTYCYYMSCVLTMVLIFGISLNHLSFHRENLKGRNQVAPIYEWKMELQLLLGDVVFTIFSITTLSGLGIAMISDFKFDFVYIFMIFNSLLLGGGLMAIGILVGSVLERKSMGIVIASLLTLVLSFFGGTFVSIDKMGEKMLKIAEFTPLYWYSHCNEVIVSMGEITRDKLVIIGEGMFIQLGFIITFFAVSLVIRKKTNKHSKNDCMLPQSML